VRNDAQIMAEADKLTEGRHWEQYTEAEHFRDLKKKFPGLSEDEARPFLNSSRNRRFHSGSRTQPPRRAEPARSAGQRLDALARGHSALSGLPYNEALRHVSRAHPQLAKEYADNVRGRR